MHSNDPLIQQGTINRTETITIARTEVTKATRGRYNVPMMPTLPLLAGGLPFFVSSHALPLWYINLPFFTSTINIEYLVKNETDLV